MGFFANLVVIILIVGLIFYLQPVENRDEILDSARGKLVSFIEPDVEPEGVEGTIEGAGGALDVIFLGKPEKEFDCQSADDCLGVVGCDGLCECDYTSGQCFKAV